MDSKPVSAFVATFAKPSSTQNTQEDFENKDVDANEPVISGGVKIEKNASDDTISQTGDNDLKSGNQNPILSKSLNESAIKKLNP